MANKTYKTVAAFQSKTGDRLIIDISAAGYNAETVKLNKKLVNDGKDAVLVVKGAYVRPRGATDKVVPKFAFDKEITPEFKLEFPFDKAEYDYSKVAYTVKDGVVRISVPKTAAARGETIAPVAADANINAIGVDDATDAATGEAVTETEE